MKSGFRIFWTEHALNELKQTLEYLEANWTEKEIRNLVRKLEETLILVAHSPLLFQVSDIKPEVRRVVISTYNTLYYRIANDQVEILSFYSNRKSPGKRKIEE